MKTKQPVVLFLASIILSAQLPGEVPGQQGPMVYSATAVGLGGLRGGPVGITIDRFTTDQEMARLATVWESGGQKGLRRELKKIRVGTIHSGSYGRIALALARVTRSRTETRIVLIAARPIARMEVERALPSRKSLFWRIELSIDESGQGQGVWEPTAEVAFTDDAELEDRLSGPQRLVLSNLRHRN